MLGNDMPRDGYYPPSTVYRLSQRIETLEAQLAEARQEIWTLERRLENSDRIHAKIITDLKKGQTDD